MKNLQSKEMPFRTINEFYQPERSPISEGIKVYPSKLVKTNVINQQGQMTTILSYLSELNKAKDITRSPFNKIINSKSQRKTIITEQLENQQDLSLNTLLNKFDTFEQRKANRSLFQLKSRKKKEEKIISKEKNLFNQMNSTKKSEKEKEMRFSFYNTIQKSQFFLTRFKKDMFLKERGSNNYQNMFKRTITTEKIMDILNRSKEKMRFGNY